MPLRLRTKFTLTTALLVLAVAAVISTVYAAAITRRLVLQSESDAEAVAQEVFLQAQHALEDAAQQGARPASPSPEDLHEYVLRALDQSAGLASQVDAALAHSPAIYEITIVDGQGTALISSDPSLPGRKVPSRARYTDLLQSSVLELFAVVYGPPRSYEVTLPFNLGPEPFGEVRVVTQTALLRNEVTPLLIQAGWLALAAVLVSTVLAAALSQVSLAPLARISAQLDRISEGHYEPEAPAPARVPPPHDEFGQVSTKINRIGQQLRGVHEIFSTLRENLNQVMTGLEHGLLLFSREGRAVMVSPAVEKFLGTPSDQLLGHCAEEIFPEGHPLRRAIRIEGNELEPVASAEVDLEDAAAHAGECRRVGVTVQSIAEEGTGPARHMGSMVILRDLESLERIGTQLQVSERLAALGRITAGVAHEVKNPLNSMRLWLENLKENLSADQDIPRQAVRVLDSEIDRLDHVVKRFLDFTRPVELHLEESNLAALLTEVIAVARPQLLRSHIEIVTEFAEGLPPVNADRQLIRQAVLNLALNAADAMPGGGRLTFRLARRGEMAEIHVADTGRGIAPEHRARVFQLFFSTRKNGSGIGLASTFRIVQLHNGSIDFESEVGRGTTFRIELPLARTQDPGAAKTRDAGQALVQEH